ncbi:helix-turn-helix domain-containing protein [Modestobacter sp. I12A-02628]|uniref:Winged helix-turn-helix transcriptional regulator n=1 Tax=Goekera deserti TaxID=2497753 RepID=A0A7K3WID7_9ACTN|nr:winged helix-turn-helix domain-containing protein [Goekera deserti]MPQ96675.1 helix-turn-helix domain-containing protein [Goekera deserti]NDI47011.1 helix-turn-helix domain-containing protein [Goekera deserti]NEL56248.1 winged helix-turn-helix transcriptional regulator [Goekera deserti]
MTSRQQPPPRGVPGGEALAALAVPARFAILSHLLDVGPRTASECAEVVGESPSNCSWHLRALARVGLVERADPDSTDGRRRPWRATAVGFDFSAAGDPAGAVAAAALEGVADRHAEELLRRYLEQRRHLPAEWTDREGSHRYTLAVTPAELDELLASLDALIRPFVGRIRTDVPADAALVHLGLRAFLHPDAARPGR